VHSNSSAKIHIFLGNVSYKHHNNLPLAESTGGNGGKKHYFEISLLEPKHWNVQHSWQCCH